uniref:Uncharacterized protein n=1 Tax=Romanomermis culicivorax TaxID=13658 RepID=A0A915HX16_ROMCU
MDDFGRNRNVLAKLFVFLPKDDVPMKVMQGQSPLPPPNPGHLAIEKAELEKSSGRPGARNRSCKGSPRPVPARSVLAYERTASGMGRQKKSVGRSISNHIEFKVLQDELLWAGSDTGRRIGTNGKQQNMNQMINKIKVKTYEIGASVFSLDALLSLNIFSR